MTTTTPAPTAVGAQAREDSTTTTVEDEVLAVGLDSLPPDGAYTPTAETTGGPSGNDEQAATGAGGPSGLALHHWVLLVGAPALAVLVIWLADHFGARTRRRRHLFLESTRAWHR